MDAGKILAQFRRKGHGERHKESGSLASQPGARSRAHTIYLSSHTRNCEPWSALLLDLSINLMQIINAADLERPYVQHG